MSASADRDEAGRRAFLAEGWQGWDTLPARLREDWRRVAAGEPLTSGARWCQTCKAEHAA